MQHLILKNLYFFFFFGIIFEVQTCLSQDVTHAIFFLTHPSKPPGWDREVWRPQRDKVSKLPAGEFSSTTSTYEPPPASLLKKKKEKKKQNSCS